MALALKELPDQRGTHSGKGVMLGRGAVQSPGQSISLSELWAIGCLLRGP